MQCGTWTKSAEGGIFTSPNYPNKYPPDRECVYIIEGDQRVFFSILTCGIHVGSRWSLPDPAQPFPFFALAQKWTFLSSTQER